MSTARLSSTAVSKMIAETLNNQIEDEIYQEMKKHAEKIIKDMAHSMAVRLRAHIINYENVIDNRLVVILNLDGVEASIASLNKSGELT